MNHNTVSVAEIKRRGMSAIAEKLKARLGAHRQAKQDGRYCCHIDADLKTERAW